MTSRRLFEATFAIVSVFSLHLDARASWTPIGIPGAEINELVADPSSPGVLWAAAGHRLYRSSDSGASWQERMDGLPKPTAAAYIRTIVPDPFQTGTLLLTAQGRGVWRTTDDGASWTRVVGPDQPAGKLVADPFVSGTFHLFSVERLVSTDHGATWQPFSTSAAIQGAAAIAADPGTSGTYYSLHTTGTGMEIRATTDSGMTSTVGAADVPGFTTPGNDSLVLRVAGDAARTLYWSGEDLFRSSDHGDSWQAAGIGRVIDIRVDPNDPTVVYATGPTAVFRTSNSGVTWQPIAVDVPGLAGIELSEIVVDPADSSRLLVGTGRYGLPGAAYGTLASENGGADWSFANTGMASERSVCNLVVGETSQILYAVAGSDVFVNADDVTFDGTLWRSSDHGGTWIPSSPPCPGTFCEVMDVAVDPADNQNVYVSTELDGVHRSLDGGATWAPANTGLTSLATTQLAIAPSDPDVLYVQTSDGLFLSTDAAATWTYANGGMFDRIEVDPFDATLLYANDGFVKSSDSGTTFAESPAVAAVHMGAFVEDLTLGLSRSSAGRAYFGLSAVALISTPTPQIVQLRKLHRSDDSLETSTSLDEFRTSSFLLVDPLDADVVYSDLGRTTDGGASWTPFVPAFPGEVCATNIDASNGRIYSGTREVEWPAASGLFSLPGSSCSTNSDCDDGNECTTKTCDAGTCTATPLPTTTPCTRDFACMANGHCNSSGACAQTTTGCNDGNACTDDICQVGNTCGHYPLPDCVPCSTNGDCDDSRPCTTDTCSAGRCSNYVTCDDGDPCTEDLCEVDVCTFEPIVAACPEGHVLDESIKFDIRPKGTGAMLKLSSRASSIPSIAVASYGDPSVQGVSIDVFNADGSITHLDIPPGEGKPGWQVDEDVPYVRYRYRNPEAPGGPTPVADIRFADSKLQIKTKGGFVVPPESALRIGIRVTSGDEIFCALVERGEPQAGRFKASYASTSDCSDAALTP